MGDHTFVYLFHILLVAPLFIFIGYKKQAVPEQLFTILMAMGVVIGLYHSYKLFLQYQHNQAVKVI
jgi:uncharacterized membrane protein